MIINNSVHDNGKGKLEFLLAMLANAIYFYNNCIGRAMFNVSFSIIHLSMKLAKHLISKVNFVVLNNTWLSMARFSYITFISETLEMIP